MVLQLVGDNSSKSSKDFASVVCYKILGPGPYLGKSFDIRTEYPNYLLKGSYETDCDLLPPNHHGLLQQISFSFRVLVWKGISHIEVTFGENKKNSFSSHLVKQFIQENEEMLTYAWNVTSIWVLPSAWYIILIIIQTIRGSVECLEMDLFIFFLHLAMWSMNAWCPSVSFIWQFLLT